MYAHNSPENFSLTSEDRFVLSNLKVPVPHNEQKRIETLRQSKLLDSGVQETGFHRFTSLASRLFKMPYAAVTFVDVDSILFKSKVGFDLPEVHRNDWFDAYTILPESSEVYVVPDCTVDNRYKDKPFVRGNPKIRFYAGAAIMIENVKIGVLSIMDTNAHRFFSLEDKENLLDLGAAAAQLAKEKLQTALNLSSERANIVVSMMHHLRTPMTSLNFATSLLCNDVHHIHDDVKVDNGSKALPAESMLKLSPFQYKEEKNQEADSKESDMNNNPTSVFQAFESSFVEINTALNQLNILVDSSLSLGQAIIKCSANDMSFQNNQNNNNNENNKSKFAECNIIDYLTDMFHNHLPVHNNNLEIEWILDISELGRGSHITFPDAVMLIVISTVSHMSAESNSLGFYFSFEQADEEDCEYPELINKMIEGKLAIKVFAKDGRLFDTDAVDQSVIDAEGSELPSKQNFLSIDKILRAINGNSKEYIADITKYKRSTGTNVEFRIVHEFFIPCKVLLHSQIPPKSSNQDKKKMRFYRGKGGIHGFKPGDKPITITEETDSPRADGTADSKTSSTIDKKEKEKDNKSSAVEEATATTGTDNEEKILRALVIEDTIPVQKLLTRWLQNHGCLVTCANNGKVGLDHLTSNTFDIAFIDFLMPVMLGITTMKLFQEWLNNSPPENSAHWEKNKDILLIGMSATALESEQEEAFKFGMHFFCPKPVSLDLLAIILAAKKESLSNEEAVNRICELTGTACDASENADADNNGLGNAIKTKANEEQDAAKGNQSKWSLFRSHKQSSSKRVHPEGEKL